MRLSYWQFFNHINHDLAPLYLISGDETVLISEVCASVRSAALRQGYQDREIIHADTTFSWNNFLVYSLNASLLSSKQILEVHVQDKLNSAARQWLIAYSARSAFDKIVLVTSSKLDPSEQKVFAAAKFVKSFVFVPIYAFDSSAVLIWIKQRLQRAHLTLAPEAIHLLHRSTEGNLTACHHIIEKLQLAYPESLISVEQLKLSLQDQAHFDLFELSEAVLQGDVQRCLRILTQLHQEGTAIALILWVLLRQLRQLITLVYRLKQGDDCRVILQEQGIWEKHKILMQQAAARYPLATWYRLLVRAQTIDRISKGVVSGSVWNALQDFVCLLAGAKLP